MSEFGQTEQQKQYSKNLFNGTYYQNVPVSEGVYDLVYNYFLDKTNLKESADALTQSVLVLSYNTKINALDILKEFDKAPDNSDLKKLMISVFNTNRGATSKIGFSDGTTINRWVQRNIVA